jgi:hypothetical protein
MRNDRCAQELGSGFSPRLVPQTSRKSCSDLKSNQTVLEETRLWIRPKKLLQSTEKVPGSNEIENMQSSSVIHFWSLTQLFLSSDIEDCHLRCPLPTTRVREEEEEEEESWSR